MYQNVGAGKTVMLKFAKRNDACLRLPVHNIPIDVLHFKLTNN